MQEPCQADANGLDACAPGIVSPRRRRSREVRRAPTVTVRQHPGPTARGRGGRCRAAVGIRPTTECMTGGCADCCRQAATVVYISSAW
jgi:hypothetical protein